MWVFWILLLCFGFRSNGLSASSSSRPAVVNIGALFALDTNIGRVAKIAIQEAVKDVNSNPSILGQTRLNVNFTNSNCSAFLGLVEALRFMETDIVAVIGPQSSVVAHTILDIANELKTPFLSFAATDPTLSSLQYPYFIRTTQSDLHQMAAIAELVTHYGWKEVIMIFVDDDYGRNGLAALDDALAARRCRISHKAPVPPGDLSEDDLMDILIKVAQMESRVIVLQSYPAVGLTVFSVSHRLGMMNDGYVWIATDWLSSALDAAPLLSSQAMMDNLQGALVLRQHTPDSKRKRAFSARWNKLTGGAVGLNAYGLYAYDTVWLLAQAIDSFFNQGGTISFSSDPSLHSVQWSKLHLDKMVIFDGGPLLLNNILRSNFVGLTGSIKFTSDRSLVFPAYEILNIIGTGLHRVGYWANNTGLSVIAPEALNSSSVNHSSMNRELNAVVWPGESVKTPRGWMFPNNGKLLKIGVPRRVSFKEFVSQVSGTNNFKGFCIDVFTAAVELLPYAVPYQFIPYGNGEENPSYGELVRLITAGVFDGAVGDIAIVTNRTRIVDFTQPYASSGLVVVAPVRELNSGSWAFLRPFSHQLWGVCVAFFLSVGIVIWILEHRINDEFRGTPKRQLITILWFSFSTLFFSHRESTMSTLGRVVLLIWLFVVLIINSSYTASLTSILTVQQLHSPIKGIETLKQGQEPIGYQVGSFAQSYLMDGMGIPMSRLRPLGSPEMYADALERGPRNGGVAAVVDEQPYIELFLASHCKFRIIGQEFTKSGWGFAFPRDSPLAIDLSTAILTLSESGDLQRIHDKWLIASTCSSDNTELQSNRLHLASFWVLYAVTGVVCLIAIIMHCSLILCQSREKNSNQPSLREKQSGSSRSKRLQRIWSLLNDRDESRADRKRRRIEEIYSETNREIDVETAAAGHSRNEIHFH